jgi:hypothetical protein
MTSTMTTLVQEALASDPFSRIATVASALLVMLLLTALSAREILRSQLRGADHSQSRALASMIPPLLVGGAIVIAVRFTGLLD